MNTKQDILLSIITPTFNSGAFIGQCLQHVADEYVDGIEHIVMDGLSTDNTAEVANAFAGNHPYLRVFSEKDSGQSDAMNRGIARARGRFLCFLNVDDYFEKGTLRFVAETLPSLGDRSILVGNCNVVDGSGKLQTLRKPSACGYPQILEFWRRDVFPPNPASYFYARHLHDLAGMYDEKEHYVLDYEMMVRLLKVAEVTYVNRTLGNFVLHEDTKTHQNSAGGQRITKRAVFERYLRERPLTERIRLRAQFYYHLRLMRSNHPLVFFAMRPTYALKRIGQKTGLVKK